VVSILRGRRKVLLGTLLVLVAVVAAPLVIIKLGEWYRDIQEAAIFARHLKGTLRRVSYQSRLFAQPQRFIVYLPPSYGNSASLDRRYPVVYLLQGCPGQPRDWLVKGDVHDTIEHLISTHTAEEMILIMADGSGPRGRFDCTLYMNHIHGTYPAETAFVRELVPLVDRRFRTLARRDGRALLGVSSGGFAALNLGVHHPELFGVLASHSGYFHAVDDPRAIRAILGNDFAAGSQNSPADHMGKIPPDRRPHIYLNVGTADPMRAENEGFARQLQQLGIHYELRVTRGRHSWNFWRRNLSYSLAWVSARLTPLAGARGQGSGVRRSLTLVADGPSIRKPVAPPMRAGRARLTPDP
jgi:enterochelin esterase-like enzyme